MYTHLFTPAKLGSMELKNRMIVPAAVTRLASSDGNTTEAFIRYHEDKAKGGWAMLITEDIPVTPTCKTYACLPGLWEDGQVASHRVFTGRIHAAGSKVCAQIYHAGRLATRGLNGVAPKAPSAVGSPFTPETPTALTVEEIGELAAAFAAAARRAKEAGYDAVELHGAHGYLIHQFLSANTNKRTDRYGGSLRGRCRFMTEVIAAARAAVGPDYPLLVRLSIVDYAPGGLTLSDSRVIARMAQEAGVDAIDCSNGTTEANYAIIPPVEAPRALYVDNAAAIKAVVDVPVIAVGRINEPGLADSVLAAGKADFVAMMRASIADPDLPNKAREGREEEIAHCIGCLQGCLGQNRRLEPFTCMVRPLTGHAHEEEILPAARAKKVLVIGGGVAGCEAAIYAAMRGHRVTLCEKTGRLGGRWIAAAIPPGKTEYNSFLVWQQTMLDKYGVEIKLNCAVTAAQAEQWKPDAIILAAGCADAVPPIPGVDGPQVVKAEDVLLERCETGKRVVVIGGGLVGAETANYLAQTRKRQVSIVEMLPNIVADGEPSPTLFLKRDLEECRVGIYTGAKVTGIGADCVRLTQEDRELTLPADTVVLAAGLRGDRTLENDLAALNIHLTVVGDAHEGKNGLKNIREGFLAGIHI